MSTASDTLAVAILITIIGGISARRQNGRFGVRSSGPYERPIGVEPHGADGANGRNRRTSADRFCRGLGLAPDLTLPARTSNGDWRGGGRPGMVADPRRLAVDCGTRHALGNRSAGGTS